MRVLLAVVIFTGGLLALNSTADAGRKVKRSAKPCYVCVGRAPAYDATGEFRGFPGWARRAFTNLRD
jgi:hypothetical protein